MDPPPIRLIHWGSAGDPPPKSAILIYPETSYCRDVIEGRIEHAYSELRDENQGRQVRRRVSEKSCPPRSKRRPLYVDHLEIKTIQLCWDVEALWLSREGTRPCLEGKWADEDR
jgi:hypothetical protein